MVVSRVKKPPDQVKNSRATDGKKPQPVQVKPPVRGMRRKMKPGQRKEAEKNAENPAPAFAIMTMIAKHLLRSLSIMKVRSGESPACAPI